MNNDIKEIVLEEIQQEQAYVRAISAINKGVLSGIMKSYKEVLDIPLKSVKYPDNYKTLLPLMFSELDDKARCEKLIKVCIMDRISFRLKKEDMHFETVDIEIALQEVIEESRV